MPRERLRFEQVQEQQARKESSRHGAHGKRFVVETLPSRTPAQGQRTAFKAQWVKLPDYWIERLDRSKRAAGARRRAQRPGLIQRTSDRTSPRIIAIDGRRHFPLDVRQSSDQRTGPAWSTLAKAGIQTEIGKPQATSTGSSTGGGGC